MILYSILALFCLVLLMPTLVSLIWAKAIIKAVGFRPYLLWCILSVTSIFMTLLTYVLSPVLSLYSVIFKKKNLPMPFYLLQTHDNDLDGGQLQGYKITTNPFRLWWQRMCWLCRNPAYGWSAIVCGIKKEEYSQVKITEYNKEDYLEFTVFLNKKTNKKRFGIRWHPKWSKKFYVKYWIGWNHFAYGGTYHQVKTMAQPFTKIEK